MNKTYCPYAWVHLHSTPSGKVYQCCEVLNTSPEKYVGDLSKNSFREIATSDVMNNVRKNMLENKEIPECSTCYEKERSGVQSHRLIVIKGFSGIQQELIADTNQDGSLKTPWKMRHFHLRLSNLCNLSCRSCSPVCSSTIALEQGLKNFVVNVMDSRPSFLDEIFELLPDATSMTFAGGEPLLIDGYWKIMDQLLLTKKTYINIFFFSNLSKIEYHGKKITDYLVQFPNHRFMVSIEGFGDRLNLLRNGADWPKIESNLRLVKDADLNYTVFSTISAINVWHMPDFERLLIENNLVGRGGIEHNILVGPKSLNMKILPLPYKNVVRDKIVKHQEFLLENNLEYISRQWDKLLEFMYADDYSNSLADFINHNGDLDQLRGQDMYQVFPELQQVKEYYEQQQSALL
jgi:radical SAM protein with 4Fe4S-binding SPASM domain